MRPHSSVHMWYRNLNLLSIGYAFRPLLRPRLTQGRSALPWKPWIFGREDSHLSLATHSGILSSYPSTAPSGTASSVLRMLLYQLTFISSTASVLCFSPGHFRRRTSRPVSCYALFECMAASEPTSWLSLKSHILFHLTHTFGTLAGGLGSFPFDCPTYLVQSDSHPSSPWHSEFDILW